MKKTLLFLLLITSFNLFSQNSKFSIELNYPIPSDNNFIGKNYTGVVDLGVKYRILNKSIVNLGLSLNTGLLTFDNSNINSPQDYKIYAYPIQPRMLCEFNIKPLEKLHPYSSIGYSFIIFKATGTNYGEDISDMNKTQNGFNINFGLAYDITKKLFVNTQYDFIKLNQNGDFPNTTYNSNVNLIKIGLGLKI